MTDAVVVDRNGRRIEAGDRVRVRLLWKNRCIAPRTREGVAEAVTSTGALRVRTDDGEAVFGNLKLRRGRWVGQSDCGKYGEEWIEVVD